MFCSQCGAQQPDDARFCSKCGATHAAESAAPATPAQACYPQPPPFAPYPVPRPALNTGTVITIVSVAVLLIVGMVVALVLSQSGGASAGQAYNDQSPASRKARESTLRGNLQMLRNAIQQFESDTGVYPAALPDLVAANGAAVVATINAADYKGPYLTPRGGINGTGIPKNPFTNPASTTVADHWKYNGYSGTLTVPDAQANLCTINDGMRFDQL